MCVGLWATEDDGVAQAPFYLSRPPGPARRLSCILECPDRGATSGLWHLRAVGVRRRRSFTTVRSPPWAPRAVVTMLVSVAPCLACQAFSRLCRLPLSLGCGAGEAEAGSVL